MRKAAGWILLLTALLSPSCGNRKHDAAYYEQMVDSIRRAEQLKEIQQLPAINSSPVETWFDTLRLHTLPIQSARGNIESLGEFATVPLAAYEHFGYPADARLRAMSLPSAHQHPVVLLCEMQDSVTPALYLYTMTKSHQPVDMLNIYHQESIDNDQERGLAYSEYFITSNYEITVMRYFKSRQAAEPRLEEARQYAISEDGRFEEQAIEL